MHKITREIYGEIMKINADKMDSKNMILQAVSKQLAKKSWNPEIGLEK
ncbi:hypothetical protein [uncultured Oscillibacter sp.]|nr:hypothetical protein [uncultured Oscillibacter sp.]